MRLSLLTVIFRRSFGEQFLPIPLELAVLAANYSAIVALMVDLESSRGMFARRVHITGDGVDILSHGGTLTCNIPYSNRLLHSCTRIILRLTAVRSRIRDQLGICRSGKS